MDRRGFLKVLGVGGALVAAAPKLIVPPVRNVVAEPARTIFLPPNGGWDIPQLRKNWTQEREAASLGFAVLGPFPRDSVLRLYGDDRLLESVHVAAAEVAQVTFRPLPNDVRNLRYLITLPPVQPQFCGSVAMRIRYSIT